MAASACAGAALECVISDDSGSTKSARTCMRMADWVVCRAGECVPAACPTNRGARSEWGREKRTKHRIVTDRHEQARLTRGVRLDLLRRSHRLRRAEALRLRLNSAHRPRLRRRHDRHLRRRAGRPSHLARRRVANLQLRDTSFEKLQLGRLRASELVEVIHPARVGGGLSCVANRRGDLGVHREDLL